MSENPQPPTEPSEPMTGITPPAGFVKDRSRPQQQPPVQPVNATQPEVIAPVQPTPASAILDENPSDTQSETHPTLPYDDEPINLQQPLWWQFWRRFTISQILAGIISAIVAVLSLYFAYLQINPPHSARPSSPIIPKTFSILIYPHDSQNFGIVVIQDSNLQEITLEFVGHEETLINRFPNLQNIGGNASAGTCLWYFTERSQRQPPFPGCKTTFRQQVESPFWYNDKTLDYYVNWVTDSELCGAGVIPCVLEVIDGEQQ